MNSNSDLQEENASVNGLELLLGLSLIGLGTYFVFRSASRAKKHRPNPLRLHHVPADITFRRILPNVYGATVTMNCAATTPYNVNLAYSPTAYVAAGPPTCSVPANSITSHEFQFTVNSGYAGSQFTVTASTPDGHTSKTLTL